MFDTKRYSCGRQYFEDGGLFLPRKTVYYNERNDTLGAWVVHNNWIVSYEAKVYRFKEHLMWTLDTGESAFHAAASAWPNIVSKILFFNF
jgi:hypothetical protein